jgi:hypothetical protein
LGRLAPVWRIFGGAATSIRPLACGLALIGGLGVAGCGGTGAGHRAPPKPTRAELRAGGAATVLAAVERARRRNLDGGGVYCDAEAGPQVWHCTVTEANRKTHAATIAYAPNGGVAVDGRVAHIPGENLSILGSTIAARTQGR